MLNEEGCVFLTDFGCSEFFHATHNNDLTKATKGTYLFMAPEMFEGNKEKKVVRGPPVDIWAAGITLFNLLTNRHPWEACGVYALAEKVKTEPPDLGLLGDGPGREDLKNLLKRVFVKDPLKRIEIYELLDDPWITDFGENIVDLDMELSNSDDEKQQLSDEGSYNGRDLNNLDWDGNEENKNSAKPAMENVATNGKFFDELD